MEEAMCMDEFVQRLQSERGTGFVMNPEEFQCSMTAQKEQSLQRRQVRVAEKQEPSKEELFLEDWNDQWCGMLLRTGEKD